MINHNEPALVGVLTGGMRAAIPLYLASVGEVFAERSGVINIGVEGIMLLGAMLGFGLEVEGRTAGFGLAAAALCGCMVGLIFGLATVTLHVNQVAAGIALIFLGKGVSSLIGAKYVGQRVQGLPILEFPALSQVPILGSLLFRHDIVTYISLLSVPILTFIMYKTRWGLLVRAVGEDPAAAERAGIDIAKVRLMAISFGGACAGLAGGYLSMVYARNWVAEMVNGRGLIAVALAIFAAWDPKKSALGALLFGTVTALQLRLQANGSLWSSYLLDMMPYALTLIILGIVSTNIVGKWGAMPQSLGKFYHKGEG